MKSTILANPTVKPSILYNAKVDEVRDTLAEGFREEFDQAMPSRTQLCPSIYAWKRQVIPTEPELAKDIDMNCPHFLTQAGENVCKATIDVAGNPRRRVMLFTTDRVMEAGVRFAERGVTDETFDVTFLSTYFSYLFVHRAPRNSLTSSSWCLCTLVRLSGGLLSTSTNQTSTRRLMRQPSEPFQV